MAFMGSCCYADSVVSDTELLLQPFTWRGGRNRIGSLPSPELPVFTELVGTWLS